MGVCRTAIAVYRTTPRTSAPPTSKRDFASAWAVAAWRLVLATVSASSPKSRMLRSLCTVTLGHLDAAHVLHHRPVGLRPDARHLLADAGRPARLAPEQEHENESRRYH